MRCLTAYGVSPSLISCTRDTAGPQWADGKSSRYSVDGDLQPGGVDRTPAGHHEQEMSKPLTFAFVREMDVRNRAPYLSLWRRIDAGVLIPEHSPKRLVGDLSADAPSGNIAESRCAVFLPGHLVAG